MALRTTTGPASVLVIINCDVSGNHPSWLLAAGLSASDSSGCSMSS